MDGVLLKMSVQRLSPKILAIGGSVEEKKQQMSSGSMPLNQKTTSYWISRLPFEFLRIGKGKKMIGPVRNDSDAVLLDNRKIEPVSDESDAVLLDKRKIKPVSDESDDISLEKPVRDSDVVLKEKVNWVMRILEVGSIWKGKRQRSGGGEEEEEETKVEFCSVDNGEDEEEEDEEVRFDREQFSRLLKKVSLVDIQMFEKLSFLGNLAYSIPQIRSRNLLRNQGLRFVTSSIDQRIVSSEKEVEKVNDNGDENQKKIINPAVAYRIAASAASRLFSQSKAVLPFSFSKGQDTSLIATADSVTAVVAAEEDVKQAVADDLKSTRSPPCEWFICDDDRTGTRFFFIQGSESLASWQANLLFEPVQFEELDVPVHRGIYEAAKGIYEQMLPEVQAHLKSRGENRAFLRFSGHSLGGSLSLLVSLMLLIRGEVPASCLLPVITFGSPCIMCGGDKLLQKLGLPKNHLIGISMHRDIVPRAFSCTYPNSAAKLLKALNGNFRNHSCLNKQKLLYSSMGQLLILQPSEKISPPHPLLPPGSGLYVLTSKTRDESEKELRAAKTAFFNSPHPLEILSDRYAYGSTGKIKRDHDMSSYLRALRHVIRKELKHRKTANDHRQVKFFLIHILCTGRDSLKLVTRFVASRSSQLVIIFFLPVRLLVISVFGVIFHHSQAHISFFK